MSLEIIGIHDLSLDEWDCVSGGTDGTSSPPPPNNLNFTTQELTNYTIGTAPCDLAPNGLPQNACWTVTDLNSGETMTYPANTTISFDDGEGTFAGGGYNDPSMFQY